MGFMYLIKEISICLKAPFLELGKPLLLSGKPILLLNLANLHLG